MAFILLFAKSDCQTTLLPAQSSAIDVTKSAQTLTAGHNIMPIKNELLDELKRNAPSKPKYLKPSPSQTKIKKRHWFLSSVLIIGGSWITHTTTATISDGTNTDILDGGPSQLIETSKDSEGLSILSDGLQTASVSNQDVPSDSLSPLGIANIDNSVSPIELATEESRKETYKVTRGDSLGYIFKKRGYDLAIPHFVSKHEVAKKLTSIRVGKELTFLFNENDQMTGIEYPLNPLQRLSIKLDGSEVSNAEIVDISFETQTKTISAEINSSLYLAAQDAGLSINLIMEMVRIFGWDVDFVQDIRRGDSFHVVYEEHIKNGVKIDDGDILAAEFTTQGQTYRAFRFENKDGSPSYFNEQGESMLGTFLRSPVEFSRISSRFGKRKHPISKKWKAHKGVDYAASTGTPIRATADGKVILAGRKGGYGKTVILRHAGRFTTLYAHMNGYAKGIKSGARVKQGQTIGYVGSTGMSTGPHLHYEFRLDGVHRNPLTFKTPKASSISPEKKIAFDEMAETYAIQLDNLKGAYNLAKSKAESEKSI